MALVLLLSRQAAPPTNDTRPSLIVQVVDPVWLPIPGATVTIKPVSGKEKSSTGQTDYDGYAKFWVTGDQDYVVEAKITGFKTKRLKGIYLYEPTKTTSTSETAYIQLRLKLSQKPLVVY